MAFLLIRGKFLPKTGQPDGDSVRFTPNNKSLFTTLEQQSDHKLKRSKLAGGGVSVQLRYEGIDAMEKDAKPGFPKQALDNNKKLLGFKEGTNTEPTGYILASGIEKNGRPIVFVFAGNPNAADGSQVFLDVPMLKKSVNYKQVEAGLVYPMYYMSLYAELRDALSAAVVKARKAGLGLWPQDKSAAGIPFKTRGAVKQLPPIFPKLYRRLQKTNKTSASAFLAELDKAGERVATLSDGRFLEFDDVLTIVGSKLKLTYKPEDLVFQEG